MTGSNATTPIVTTSNVEIEETQYGHFEELFGKLLKVKKSDFNEVAERR